MVRREVGTGGGVATPAFAARFCWLLPALLSVAGCSAPPNTSDTGVDGSRQDVIVEGGDAMAIDAPLDVGADGSAVDARHDSAADSDTVAPADVAIDALDDTPDSMAVDATIDATFSDSVDTSDTAADVPAADVPVDTGCPVAEMLCGATCVDTTSDSGNCGMCGHVCPSAPPGGTESCTAGVCVLACGTSLTLCGAVCADVATDASNCGACGTACTSGLCVAGACATIDPPRLIAPLSASRVTRSTPTLHWELSPGTTGARVQVCSDRGCTAVEQTLNVTGSSAAVATLTRGLHYWRAFGASATSVGAMPSATWEFSVGARSTAVDSSWGTTLDVDGNGYAEVAVGAWAAGGDVGRVDLFAGTTLGVNSLPMITLTGPDGGTEKFGWSVASAGDMNGDGYTDLVVGAPGYASTTGRVYVYLGGASGLGATPAASLTGPDGIGGSFGNAVAGTGDVDGDGYADIVVGAPDAASGNGRMYVYAGSASGIGSSPVATVTGTGGAFAYDLASAGDLNGDGFGDVVAGAWDASAGAGRAFVYLGSSSGLVTATPTTLRGTMGPTENFGFAVDVAGDVNGDGFADIVVGAPGGEGTAYVFGGNALGVGSSALTYVTGFGSGFGDSVAGAGDMNRDGFDDVLVGAPNANQVSLYDGSTSGLPFSASTSYGGGAPSDQYGFGMAGVGDLNGDGCADIALGAPHADGMLGTASVFFGSSPMSGAGAFTPLDGPTSGTAFFGDCIAALEIDHRTRRTLRDATGRAGSTAARRIPASTAGARS